MKMKGRRMPVAEAEKKRRFVAKYFRGDECVAEVICYGVNKEKAQIDSRHRLSHPLPGHDKVTIEPFPYA